MAAPPADEAPAPTHRYRARVAWSGSTGGGIAAYDRTHEASCPPAAAPLALTSFLAVAARARVDVVAYEDDAEGVMPEDDPPARIVRIVLRPRIAVRGDAPEQRLRGLFETAHRHCYIANSLSSEIVLEPAFRRVS